MWHYVENGQQAGPVTAEQMAQLFAEGKINGDTLVWQPGMENWRPYREFLPAGEAPPQANPSAPAQEETVCAECGKIFPVDETIRHGNVRVCAACKPVFLQKLTEGAKINTGALNLAGIGTRFAAVFIDGLLLMVVNVGVGFILGMTAMQVAGTQPTAALSVQLISTAINLLIAMAYETIMIGKYGATLGKMACKIKVVTADGGNLTYMRSLGRHFSKILSSFICMIGYIIACFDEEKRALHDRICNTRVVMK